MNLERLRTCTLCKKDGDSLLKYSVRHYAHGKCLIEKHGFEWLLGLPASEIGKIKLCDMTNQQAFIAVCVMELLEGTREGP